MAGARPIGIVGAGSWGTALAIALARNGRTVQLWSVDRTELDPLPRFQALHTSGQRGRPDVDVLTVLLGQKAEALLGVVPLNAAGRHWSHPLVSNEPLHKESVPPAPGRV